MLLSSALRGSLHFQRLTRTLGVAAISRSDDDIRKRLQQTIEKKAAKGKSDRAATGRRIDEAADDSFGSLRISQSIIEGLATKGISEPTGIQKTIIPLLMQFPKDNFVFSSATGSGKTLSYLLPVMQQLLWEEEAAATQRLEGEESGDERLSSGWFRREGYPRCLILAPTRDLAQQILGEVKSLSHFAKLSSCGVVGGGGKSPLSGAEKVAQGKSRSLSSSSSFTAQKQNLARKVDIVVATPGRLLQHYQRGNVHLNQVSTIIIDEMDTMLLQGFRADIQNLLYCASRAGYNNYMRSLQKAHKRAMLAGEPAPPVPGAAEESDAAAVIYPAPPGAPRVVMVTATITRELKSLLPSAAPSGAEGALLTSLHALSSRSGAPAGVQRYSSASLGRIVDALKGQLVQSSEAVMVLPPPSEEDAHRERDDSVPYGAFHSTPYTPPGKKGAKSSHGSDAAEDEAQKLSFQVIQLRDVHQKLPNVAHNHISVGSAGGPINKMDLLLETILKADARGRSAGEGGSGRVARTMVFCNTIASCRAVDYFLAAKVQELNRRATAAVKKGSAQMYRLLSYHGDLNSSRRTLNLQEFRNPQMTFVQEDEDEGAANGDEYGDDYVELDSAGGEQGGRGVPQEGGSEAPGQWDDQWGEDMGDESTYAYLDGDDDVAEPVAWRTQSTDSSRPAEANHQAGPDDSALNVHAIMICTDIAARGLDIPDTDKVIMFDFPMNPIDYIHRAGRTGRAGRKGEVTALVSKRDVILSQGILASMKQQQPLDLCTSDKDDYYLPGGKLHHLMTDITHRVPASKVHPKARKAGGFGSVGVRKARKVVNVSDPGRFSSATINRVNKADAKADKRRSAASGSGGKPKAYQGSKPSRMGGASASKSKRH